MSYEHRGLVIGSKQRLLYVLPIFSFIPDNHIDVYHPVEHPTSNLFLLKSSEFPFISHDSVLKLNDIRTVSVKRILYQHKGRIDTSSETYKKIESLVLQKYFPSFYYDYEKNNEELKSLTKQISVLKAEKDNLESEIKKLKS